MDDTLDARKEYGRWSGLLRTRLDPGRIQGTSWVTIVAVVVVASAMTAAFQLNSDFLLGLMSPIIESTDRLIHPTLLVYIPFIAVVIGGLIFWFGGLRLRDVGLVRDDVRLGVAVTVGTWVLMQATAAAVLLLQGHPLRIHDSWATIGTLAIVGSFLGQLLGNAFFEEVVYRAFLLVQLAKKFERLVAGRSRRAFLLALLVSQTVFALIHVPSRLVQGVPPESLFGAVLIPFVFGVLLALIYYRTANLFVVIGLHALINQPVLVVDAGGIVLLPLLLVVLGIVLAWPYVEPRLDGRRRRETGVKV
jgi:hypothetical protein